MSEAITVVITTIPPRTEMLARAIKSVQAQTLQPECIIVVTDHDKQGAAKTRTRGLMNVKTPWTAFLDDDDEFGPDHLKTLMMHQESTGADLVYSWFWVVGADDPLFVPNEIGILVTPLGVPFDDRLKNYILHEGNFIPVTTLVRTKLAQKVKGFPDPKENQWWSAGGLQNEDHGFLVELLEAGAKFSHAPFRTWKWHHHHKNTSGRPEVGQYIHGPY